MEAVTNLDKLIERRSAATPDPDELEPSYAESVRRHREAERREHLWQRLRFHERMLENHTRMFQAILDKHKAGRERCESLLGLKETERKMA